ncbi:hypothetical protein LB559_30850 [Mesorhizobium sp. BR1-1-3]|uniref:hypothetical protein n=1 Tax=Mesorhizobium sp. BR1-1-3 TaxID=2876651 RepID=UPI001CD080AF|nr:hypothetical protein [Mesorhizobium sp. BR1-1-3]MBZ9892332.1 hypothetical protein [Mesorhizobium sp. BR1-1-3]
MILSENRTDLRGHALLTDPMSAALRFSKRVSGKAFLAAPTKQNGPLFSGPFVTDIEPITGPVQVPAQGLVPAQEPVRARVPGQAPVLQVPEQARAQVQPASSVPPVQALGPVCWPPAARRVPGAHHFFRKHNTRQPPE